MKSTRRMWKDSNQLPFSGNKAMSPNGEGGIGGAICIDRKASIKVFGCIALPKMSQVKLGDS